MSAEYELHDDDGSNRLEVEETEVTGEATRGGRGWLEGRCMMESRRSVEDGQDKEDDEEEAN
jgi:hypothetical protein